VSLLRIRSERQLKQEDFEEVEWIVERKKKRRKEEKKKRRKEEKKRMCVALHKRIVFQFSKI
jgi:tRNA 2-selenouridine synthase SelU